MRDPILYLGQSGLTMCQRLGRSGIFLGRVLWQRPRFKVGIPLVLQSIYSIGVLSLVIIVISSLFIGMVVSLQGYNTLDKFGATQQLGQLLALAIVRELGPVVAAFLFLSSTLTRALITGPMIQIASFSAKKSAIKWPSVQ